MNEQEWLESSDPIPMLSHLQASAVSRKVLKFTNACFCRQWDLLPSVCRQWAEATLGVAEGRCSLQDLAGLEDDAEAALYALCEKGDYVAQGTLASLIDIIRVGWEFNEAIEEGDNTVWQKERAAQAKLMRDIFGNPFHPVVIDPAWLTPKVTTLAQAIYDERRFADMPMLADALEEAGCTNADILNHCRQPGDHVRGCWVVDLLLGKT